MVPLGFGQAVLGGRGNGEYHRKIYSMTCSDQICMISMLSKELSIPRAYFVAIPIPDSMSGCISQCKFEFVY